MDLDRLTAVHLFPVRHHSPRSSAVLRALLDRVRPKAVFVEGPSDATPLLGALVDPETVPPIAILGYRTDGTPGSSLWPFAAYSPEYVAVKWAIENGARVELVDIPIGATLAPYEHDAGEGAPPAPGAAPNVPVGHDDLEDPGGEGAPPPGERPISVYEACARARGLRSFEEFWEASFEAPAYDPASFRDALLAYAELVREDGDRPIHRARDAYMARTILERLGDVRPEEAVAVLGAAHAAAFVARDVDPALEARLPAPVPSASTIIPYSFPRLAEQLGYGAGNRAPQYYQRAHDAGCSFRRATLEVLVEFTEHLRLRGFMASLADTIEAYRLAVALADHRGKAEPGLDEVREATIATMCRGDATHVDGFLWPAVIGRKVGKVAARIGRNSLQEEFWREVRERALPESDAAESFTLKLNNDTDTGTSVFLHRLRIVGIPYATYVGRQKNKVARAKQAAAELSTKDFLERLSEAWEAQWTPATDVALVEKIVLGDTLEQVTTRALEEALAGAQGAGDAADVLLNAVLTGCTMTVSSALRACDRLAANDDALPSLARACRNLSGLVSFGSTRALSAIGDDAIPALCQKTFARAVLRVREACTGNDEAVGPAKVALRTLHDIALSQPLVDRQAWLEAARELVDSDVVNPSTSGLAAGLLYLAQSIRDEEVATIVSLRLGGATAPASAASFLEGFFEVNALVLVKSRPVVEALDGFLVGIEAARFKDTLPVLRRAFSHLGNTERRYLLENVLAFRNLAEKARAAQAVLLEKDKEKLKEMTSELSQAMDDLDDLL